MKRNAVGTLIKDIILAVVAWGICALLINGMWGVDVGGTLNTGTVYGLATFFAGVPFGWRWASNIITALTPKGIVIKFVISMILGWLAIFVVIIGDIIRCIAAKAEPKRRTRSVQEFE